MPKTTSNSSTVAAEATTSANLSRNRPSESARLEVLYAAAEAFRTLGFEATTIDDIGNLMGATKGRVYHYYRSKASILLDVHLTAMDMVLSEIGPLAKGPGAPKDRLRAMVVRNIELNAREQSLFFVAVAGIFIGFPSALRDVERTAVEEIRRQREQFEQLFIDVIEEGIRVREFRKANSRIVTKALVGAMQWTVVWLDVGRPVDAITREISDQLLSGLSD